MRSVDLSKASVRRLAITCQRLAGPRASSDPDGLRDVLRSLRCLQLDPINVVARSHELVLWSRVGAYDRADFDTLVWEDRWLFEYWAHAASMVLTEDYQLHQGMMRHYPLGLTAYGKRLIAWNEANGELRRHVLSRLEEGPRPTGGFEDRSVVGWESGGWTTGRNVERMLDLLWTQGAVMVSGRRGRQRLWDLADRCLPEWADRSELPDTEVVSRSAEHALRALGAARPRDVEQHFTRGRYPGLEQTLKQLVADGRVVPARVEGDGGPWYVHADVLPLLDVIEGAGWGPRTTLLSPFDNLVCDRDRTELLWDFRFRNEMYVPKAKRKFGYYVLPVLDGDRLVGRLAPRLDRRRGVLGIENVFAEEDAAEEAGPRIAGAVAGLAGFAGATAVEYTGAVPAVWRGALRGGHLPPPGVGAGEDPSTVTRRNSEV